jgi:hypothetical protein
MEPDVLDETLTCNRLHVKCRLCRHFAAFAGIRDVQAAFPAPHRTGTAGIFKELDGG